MDPKQPKFEQKTQINRWFESVFKEFIRKHGSLKVTESGIIEFKHFIEIYNIIEACIKLELVDQRDNNERQRSSLFIGAFTDNNKSRLEEYTDLVLKTMEHECDEYAIVLTKVLKHVGVQEIIW